MKMHMLSILTLVAAAGVSAQAATPAAPASGKSLFVGADANHDGVLSRSEIPQGWSDLRAHFKAQDKDHDLRLSPIEFDMYLATLINNNWSRPGGSGVPQFPVAARAGRDMTAVLQAQPSVR